MSRMCSVRLYRPLSLFAAVLVTAVLWLVAVTDTRAGAVPPAPVAAAPLLGRRPEPPPRRGPPGPRGRRAGRPPLGPPAPGADGHGPVGPEPVAIPAVGAR